MKNLLRINFDINNSDWHQSPCVENLELSIDVDLFTCMEQNYSKPMEKVLNITDNEYIPTDKDKLFFLPAVSVPRIKLKDLAIQRGIKTTRDITTADAIFASNRTLDKITDYKWFAVFSTADFKLFFEAAKEYIEIQDIRSIETALEFYTEDIILTDHLGCRIMCNTTSPYQLVEPLSGTTRFLHFKVDYQDLGELLLKKGLCNIYDESEILRHVNGSDCVTIDVDMYRNLSEMFDSDDNDNHILAMEIMANCNYTDSLLFLEMLFMNYARVMSASESKNHVNFKGLLSYLDKRVNNMDTTIDAAMSSLQHKGKMTKDNVQILLMHQYEKNLSISGSYQYFSIKTVSLKPEHLEKLGEDLDFKVQADFIPVVQEEDELQELLETVEESNYAGIGTEHLLPAAEVATEAVIEVLEETPETKKLIASEEESPFDEDIIVESKEGTHYDL